MSMESATSTNTGYKQILSLLWLALRKAASAVAILTASGNRVQAQNTAPIGPSLVVQFTATITPTVSGKIRVFGGMAGVMSAVDLTGTFQLGRGLVAIGPPIPVSAGHVTADVAAPTIEWTDSQPVGTPVTYNITFTGVGGSTTTVATAQAFLTLQELPA
jgi:hypothetical protein